MIPSTSRWFPATELRKVIARGVPGTLQPAFALNEGGTLTDAQIDALVGGVMDTWGKAAPVKTGRPAAVCRGSR